MIFWPVRTQVVCRLQARLIPWRSFAGLKRKLWRYIIRKIGDHVLNTGFDNLYWAVHRITPLSITKKWKENKTLYPSATKLSICILNHGCAIGVMRICRLLNKRRLKIWGRRWCRKLNWCPFSTGHSFHKGNDKRNEFMHDVVLMPEKWVSKLLRLLNC